MKMNDINPEEIITYILQNGNDYYVGKTNSIDRRMEEHERDRWSKYLLVWSVAGDHERQIKAFEVGRFFRCVNRGLIP